MLYLNPQSTRSSAHTLSREPTSPLSLSVRQEAKARELFLLGKSIGWVSNHEKMDSSDSKAQLNVKRGLQAGGGKASTLVGGDHWAAKCWKISGALVQTSLCLIVLANLQLLELALALWAGGYHLCASKPRCQNVGT